MESTKTIVKKPYFTKVLDCFKTEELLTLRNLSKVMDDVVRNHHLRKQNLKLHESKYLESFSKYIQSAKTLTIDGMTLTENTSKMFSDFPDKMFESLESLELNLMSIEEEKEAWKDIGNCQIFFNSIFIAAWLQRFNKLSHLKIQVWQDAIISNFINALNEFTESKFYKTVIHLEVIINENVLSNTADQSKSQDWEAIENFIGNFEYIKKLTSFPIDGFNPFSKLASASLEEVVVFTPATADDLKIVSKFVTNSSIKRLKLLYIQSVDVQYVDMVCPATLQSLTLKHLSTVDLGNFLTTFPEWLQYIYIDDIFLQIEGLKSIIACLEILPDLKVLHLDNIEWEKQEIFL